MASSGSDSEEDKVECVVCFVELLSQTGELPIWNCREGHLLCDGCYKERGGESSACPTCNVQLDSLRNRPLEKIRDKKLKKAAARKHTDGKVGEEGPEQAATNLAADADNDAPCEGQEGGGSDEQAQNHFEGFMAPATNKHSPQKPPRKTRTPPKRRISGSPSKEQAKSFGGWFHPVDSTESKQPPSSGFPFQPPDSAVRTGPSPSQPHEASSGPQDGFAFKPPSLSSSSVGDAAAGGFPFKPPQAVADPSETRSTVPAFSGIPAAAPFTPPPPAGSATVAPFSFSAPSPMDESPAPGAASASQPMSAAAGTFGPAPFGAGSQPYRPTTASDGQAHAGEENSHPQLSARSSPPRTSLAARKSVGAGRGGATKHKVKGVKSEESARAESKDGGFVFEMSDLLKTLADNGGHQPVHAGDAEVGSSPDAAPSHAAPAERSSHEEGGAERQHGAGGTEHQPTGDEEKAAGPKEEKVVCDVDGWQSGHKQWQAEGGSGLSGGWTWGSAGGGGSWVEGGGCSHGVGAGAANKRMHRAASARARAAAKPAGAKRPEASSSGFSFKPPEGMAPQAPQHAAGHPFVRRDTAPASAGEREGAPARPGGGGGAGASCKAANGGFCGVEAEAYRKLVDMSGEHAVATLLARNLQRKPSELLEHIQNIHRRRGARRQRKDVPGGADAAPPLGVGGVEAARERGNELFNRGDWAGAEREYSGALSGSSAQGEWRAVLLSNRGAARIRLGNKMAALKDCEEALRVEPGLSKPALRSKAALRGAKVALELGLLERSEALYQQVVQECPGAQQDLDRVRQLQREVAQAEALLEEGEGERAMACVKDALGAAPDSMGIKLLRVRILLKCRRFEDAAAACQELKGCMRGSGAGQLVGGEPAEGVVRLLASSALQCTGDLANAQRELEKLVAMDPEGRSGKEQLRLVRKMAAAKQSANDEYAAGQWEAAAKSYQAALLLNPEADGFNAQLWCNRAAAMLKLKKHKDVIADSSKALDLKPDYAKALIHRARAYMASGDSKEAVLDLERAIVADPRCEVVLKEELDAARKAASHKTEDHYAVLGVDPSASSADIKKAFRTLALQYHPDKQGKEGKEARERAERQFKRVSDAHAVLMDAKLRREYDRERELSRVQRSTNSHPWRQWSSAGSSRAEREWPFRGRYQAHSNSWWGV